MPGSVDLTYCDLVYKDLSKGLEGLLLNSYLHLVYLVTPYDLIPQCNPDWMVYFRQKMSAAVGVPESFVARKAAGQTVKKDMDLVVVKRMFLALVLFSLLKETNVWSVAERFQLSRGFVQTLLSSASAFCSCELEEFWPYKALLMELTRRLSYCVKAELIPLMEVAGVLEVRSCCCVWRFVQRFVLDPFHQCSSVQFRAKQLYNAGYKTLTHLANADPAVLCRTIENLFKKQAHLMVASAKVSVLCVPIELS
ncbi:hypothetical protein XENOCAPTIV_009097 [Xenoophorus captivus]|uniref:POLQ-like helical domain-containing protein n=1 Tax=Xenoophorus captivus TaxID=1517983 RepID=A0ABV0SFC3_9TELE